MNFSIALADLETLLTCAGLTRPRHPASFTLAACAARVFVESNGEAAGIEAIVLSDGAVELPTKKFRALLKTYKGTRFLTFEGGLNGLRIQNFHMPVLAYDPKPKPPGDFQVFRTSAPATGANASSSTRLPS